MIKVIPAQLTYRLRSLVLRAGKPVEECVFDKDEEQNTFHLAFYNNERIVCVASFMPSSNNEIQIRGMATHPDHRGSGYAQSLLVYGEEIALKKGFSIIWCNARESAQGFYQKNGYSLFGDYFEIPEIGKHIVMKKNL